MRDERLVLIEWEDSHASGSWQELDVEIQDRALMCRSVGWLILDGANVKVVAPHMNRGEPGVAVQGNGVMTIPTRSVVRTLCLTIGGAFDQPWSESGSHTAPTAPTTPPEAARA